MNRPAHVEFGIDPSAHQGFQMSASDPIWAIFHRPGTAASVTQAHDEPLWSQVCTCVTAILTTLRPAYADILRRAWRQTGSP